MFIRLPFLRHASIVPFSSDAASSGTISSGSNSHVVPSPWQSGHAPCGELKLNSRGSSSGSDTSGCSGQANFSLKTWSFQVLSAWATVTITSPCDSFRAVSIESARRERISGLSTIRSTIASMLWANVFFRAGAAAGVGSSWICPSTRARTKPCLWIAPKMSLCSPFCPRTSGERIITFVPAGYFITASTIWLGVWLAISRPHFQQWGVPARANRTRR